ncbi:hypothetical protein [Candidatus Regiella endosymbiont of Tuberolachnus salignus]|uniref:hypothetical protein n=1 Tax=Candidatus Regiella endosymbiont of Tuberolachnus salignus TaxID=3077956 RepID=UPI0030D18B9E
MAKNGVENNSEATFRCQCRQKNLPGEYMTLITTPSTSPLIAPLSFSEMFDKVDDSFEVQRGTTALVASAGAVLAVGAIGRELRDVRNVNMLRISNYIFCASAAIDAGNRYLRNVCCDRESICLPYSYNTVNLAGTLTMVAAALLSVMARR